MAFLRKMSRRLRLKRILFVVLMPTLIFSAFLMTVQNTISNTLISQNIELYDSEQENLAGIVGKRAPLGSILSIPCLNTETDEMNSMDKLHVYANPAHLRLIVLTYNRFHSLKKLLDSLQGLELEGHTATLEIWIDRNKANQLDGDTYRTARSFCWDQGPVTVHIHSSHVGIYGQWIFTWKPKPNGDPANEELAIIIEDDIDVSKYAYRWLRKAHQSYSGQADLSGYSLQDENLKYASGKLKGKEISKRNKGPVYLFPIAGSWGFAPHPRRWIEFQEWYLQKANDKSFKPYVEQAQLHTDWYKVFEKRNVTDTMWTMWFIRFCYERSLFSLYYNIPTHKNITKGSLVSNRKEAGLHYTEKKRHIYPVPKLLQEWNDVIDDFPPYDKVKKYDYRGQQILNNMKLARGKS